MTLQSFDALGRIGEPRASGHVAIASCVAVGEQIEPGARLVGQIAREGVGVLLAKRDVGHRQRERPPVEIGDEPVRPRQRAGDGGEQRSILGDRQHGGRVPSFTIGTLRHRRMAGNDKIGLPGRDFPRIAVAAIVPCCRLPAGK